MNTFEIETQFKEMNEKKLKERTIKIAEELFKILNDKGVKFQEGIIIADTLKNYIIRKGSEFLNNKELKNI